MPQVLFYLPWRRDGTSPPPTRVDDYWDWIVRHRGVGEGKYSWTLQTYLQLNARGFDCKLVTEFPRAGLVVSHRDFLPVTLAPRRDVFLVCIKPDRKEHSWAHHYVVQNKHDRAFRRIPPGHVSFVKHWPQPSLLPRDTSRGSTVRNIAYFGRSLNLAGALRRPEWAMEVEKMGMRWLTPEMECWNDYRKIDVTVAIRSFDLSSENADPILDPNSKPPTKLTNSWLAGVPTIVGPEPAYSNLGSDGLDLVRVASIEELTSALQELQQDPEYYATIQTNGMNRATEFSAESVCASWLLAFDQKIFPSYVEWAAQNSARRQTANIARLARYFSDPPNVRDALRVIKASARP